MFYLRRLYASDQQCADKRAKPRVALVRQRASGLPVPLVRIMVKRARVGPASRDKVMSAAPIHAGTLHMLARPAA